MNASVVTPPAPRSLAQQSLDSSKTPYCSCLVLLMIPATILLIGAPIALLIRVLIELAGRF